MLQIISKNKSWSTLVNTSKKNQDISSSTTEIDDSQVSFRKQS